MRAKLERIAAGKIEYEKPKMSLSESLITLNCRPGEKAESSFTVTADRQIKGIVYASSWRMQVEHPSFSARTARIGYSFDGQGLWGGEEIEGEFCIVAEAGEYLLPYTVRVAPHEEPKEEGYAYFISADPIEPLPEEKRSEQPEEVLDVKIIENTEKKELTPGEALELADQIRRGRRPEAQGFARVKEAYERYGGSELLSAICSILIKNGSTDEESFSWYRRGVELELKITNLYEYFMMSVPGTFAEAFPRNLLLYFLMENTLNNAQKALLYANVIRFQPEDGELYRRYRDRIEAFMLDQLLERRLSENMAVIYERFLVEELLTIDFAEALSDIMFLRRFRCDDRRIRHVQVLYEQLQQKITVPLSHGEALIPIYTPGAVIVLVDEQGSCYTSSVPYTLTRLMNERRYVDKCRELLRYHRGLYLYLCDGMSRCHVITRENVENYKRVLKIEGFTAHYKEDVRQEILQFYYANQDLDDLDQEFFVTETTRMTPKDRARYVEILILRGMYGEAWDTIRAYDYSMVRVKLLLKLAVWKMRELEYEEDAFLLKLCLHIFREHKYNEGILEYLSGYYYGSVAIMEEVWNEAHEFELDVFDLEERILGQMLFTGQVKEEAYGIFEDYRALGGDGLVARAYLTWMSWQDFVRDEKVPEGIYGQLAQAIAWEAGLAPVCELAYLRYLSGRRKLTESEEIRAERMTKLCIQKKMRFSFMKPLLARLGRSELLEDKTFVEYRANPEHKVILHYVIESPRMKNCNYVAERLYPVEPGLFVKEFTLFYDDRLTWFVTEEDEEGEHATPDHSFVEGGEEPLVTGTKYASIYEMARALSEHDMPELRRQYGTYGKKKFLVETMFSLK